MSKDENKNIIGEKNQLVWTPEIEFIDNVLPPKNNLHESNIIVTTLKQENGIFDGYDNIYKNKIYSGAKNKIVKNSSFVGSFVCSFPNIWLYPFDMEICYLKIIMPTSSYYFTIIIPLK